MKTLLEQLQEDVYARLLTDPWFGDIALVLQRKGVTVAELLQGKGVLAGRGGKVGACILILMPGGGAPDELPGPRLELIQSFVALTHPEINARSSGTGKSTEEIALRLLQLFDRFSPGYGAVLKAEQDALVPTDSFDNLVGYQVNLHTFGGPVWVPPVITPAVSAPDTTAPTTVTVTCATAGATIWVTKDGSYPSSANAAASIYGAPFAQATAATIRAAAEKSGLLQSNVAQLTLS